MECPRCQGRMVQERFEDMLDTCLSFVGWRCLICGDIMDEVVARHRQSSLVATGRKPVVETESIVG